MVGARPRAARATSALAMLSALILSACAPSLRDDWYGCTTGSCPALIPYCHPDGICRTMPTSSPLMDAGETNADASVDADHDASLDANRDASRDASLDASADANHDTSVPLQDVRDAGTTAPDAPSRDAAMIDTSTSPEPDTSVPTPDASTLEMDTSVPPPLDVVVVPDIGADTPADIAVASPLDVPPDLPALDARIPTGGQVLTGYPGSLQISALTTGAISVSALMTGTLSGPTPVGTETLTPTGPSDAFSIAVGTSGIVLSALAIGATGQERGTDIVIDASGNIIVAGTSNMTESFGCGATSATIQTVFAAAFTGGACVWQTNITADAVGVPTLAVNGTGTTWIGASVTGSPTWSGTPLMYNPTEDFGYGKYDSGGVLRVVRRGGGSGYQRVADVIDDGAGGMWMAGTFDEGFSYIGASVLFSLGSSDVFLLHVDANGDPITTFHFGGANADAVVGLAPRAAGGVWLLGNYTASATVGRQTARSAGPRDYFVVGVNGFSVVTSMFGGGANYAEARAISADASGNVWVTGAFRDRILLGGSMEVAVGEEDIFVLGLRPDLTHRRSFRVGGLRADSPTAIVASADANVWLAGTIGPAPVDFGIGVQDGATLPTFLYAFRNE